MSDLIPGNTSSNTTIAVGSSVMAEIESKLKARKDFPSNLPTPKVLLATFLERAAEGAGRKAGVRIIDLADLLVTLPYRRSTSSGSKVSPCQPPP